MIPPVIRSAWVPRVAEDAFRVFTDEIGAWWPLPSHGIFGDRSGGVAFDDSRLVERSIDGHESTWAEIVEWDPPRRVVLDWHPGRDPAEATVVEISFQPVDDGTRVIVEHHGWERLEPHAIEIRRSYRGPNAWGAVLDHFGDIVEAGTDAEGLDTLRAAHAAFAAAAAAAMAASTHGDGWTAREVVAHVALNDLAMLRVCQALVHGVPARFDNESSQDPAAMSRWLAAAGDDEHVLRRSRAAAEQTLAALGRLSAEQLATPVPCRLTHDGRVVLDDDRPWSALAVTVQAERHLPDHIAQLELLTATA